MSQEPIPLKLVVIGDGYVGKTSILHSYCKQQFKTDYQPTIFDSHSVIVKVGKKLVSLGLWDTAGQEQYSSLRPLAYKNCDIFMIVFSVTEKSSYHNARDAWLRELQSFAGNSLKIFVGNKIDLRQPDNPAHISYKKAYQQLVNELKIPYIQCSALTRKGIEQAFMSAVRMSLERKKILYKQNDCVCTTF